MLVGKLVLKTLLINYLFTVDLLMLEQEVKG